MSANRPIGSRSALIVSVYPISTHCVVGRSVRKCSEIVGSATETLPMSDTDANSPIASARKAQYR